MSSKLSSKELFKWAQYLGSRVAETTKIGKHNAQILKETSCMSKQYRELVAYCELLKLGLDEGDPDVKAIDEELIPAFQILGMSDWETDVLTHLARRVGTAEQFYGGEANAE